MIRLIVFSLYDRANGRGRPDLWRVEFETGEVLLERARAPMMEGARALLATGADPETRINTRHSTKEHDNFVPMRLGVAARWTVSELAERSAHFRKWRPGPEMPADCGGVAEEPALVNGSATYPAGSANGDEARDAA